MRRIAVLVATALAAINPDCSLNGDLKGGVCVCDAAWYGPECELLSVLPASPDAGLQLNKQSPNMNNLYSSWGGSVIKEGDIYHMFAAVMENGCGLNAWRPNSAIGHATSKTPAGPYQFQSIIKSHFAHSPEIIRAADGSYLIYHVGAGVNDTAPCPDPKAQSCQYTRNCTGGCTGPNKPYFTGLAFYGPSAVLHAQSLEGPWTSTVIGACGDVPGCAKNSTYPGNGNDMNPAPWVFKNGTIKMLWRSINYTKGSGQSYYSTASAPAWDGPYDWSTENIFPNFSACHIEDGHLYRNARGWHAVFHSDCQKHSMSKGAAGGHAWSKDGKTWTFHEKNCYNNKIALTDGTEWVLSRRERPKLIINEGGQITHLLNSVSLPGVANGCGSHPAATDHVFTFAQPVSTANTTS
jgi:hypothetical protein